MSFIECNADMQKTRELLREMKSFVCEFYCNFKANYSRLSTKHRLQLKTLKTQHSVKQPVSNSWSNPKQSFFNETYDEVMSPSREKPSREYAYGGLHLDAYY